MTEIEKLLYNPAFEGKTIAEALDYCIKQDPETPQRFLTDRAKLQDDEEVIRKYAGNPDPKLGLWRMHQSGRINCTCEAVALHFPEFKDIRHVVLEKVERLLTKGN